MTLGNEKTEVFLFWMFARNTVLHPITGRTDRQTDRRTDRQTDRQTDGQTDRQTECDAICGPLLGRRAA